MTAIRPVTPASAGMAAPAASAGAPEAWQSALHAARATGSRTTAASASASASRSTGAVTSKAAGDAAGQSGTGKQPRATSSSTGNASDAGGSADTPATGRGGGTSTGSAASTAQAGVASQASAANTASALTGKAAKAAPPAPNPPRSKADAAETRQKTAGSGQTAAVRHPAAADGSGRHAPHGPERRQDAGTGVATATPTAKGQSAATEDAAASGQAAGSASTDPQATKKRLPVQTPASQTALAGALQAAPQHAGGSPAKAVAGSAEKGGNRADAVAASVAHRSAQHHSGPIGATRERAPEFAPGLVPGGGISASTQSGATIKTIQFAHGGGQTPAGQPLTTGEIGQALQGANTSPGAVAANQSAPASSSLAQNALNSRLAQATLAVLHDGGGSVTLKLHPATLGSLTITVGAATGGGTAIGIAASDPGGLAAIQAASANMVQHMTSAGVPVASISTTLSAAAQGDAGARQQGQHAPPPRSVRSARADVATVDEIADPRVIARA